MSKFPKANKVLGQHFLRDQTVIQKICQDHVNDCDVIIEVGPGPGVLTEVLAAHGKPLYLIEKDRRFEPILDKLVPKTNLYITDALEFNWEDFLESNSLKDKKNLVSIKPSLQYWNSSFYAISCD